MSNKILGFDLSFSCTGWCLIEDTKILAMGSFKLQGTSTGSKLSHLCFQSSRLIMDYEPEVVAVEEIFFSKWTASSFKPLAKLQAVLEMVCFRLNRSRPELARATEVRASFELDDSKKMKKDFIAYCKKQGYTRLSKGKLKDKYDEFKKATIVKFVNSLYKNDYPNGLLTNDQHDIADAILLSRHIEGLLF